MQNLQQQDPQRRRFLRRSSVLSWRKFFATGRWLSLKGAGPARKFRVYASHPFGTFHVDARIPRLYITHGRMAHNESSPTMFRIGFVMILLAFAAVVGVSSVAPLSSPTQATEHTKTGIDVLEEQNFAPLRGKHVGL